MRVSGAQLDGLETGGLAVGDDGGDIPLFREVVSDGAELEGGAAERIRGAVSETGEPRGGSKGEKGAQRGAAGKRKHERGMWLRGAWIRDEVSGLNEEVWHRGQPSLCAGCGALPTGSFAFVAVPLRPLRSG